LNYLGMISGLIIALGSIFNPGYQGFMRWVMIICGLLTFVAHLKIRLDKKQNSAVSQNKKRFKS